MLGLNEKNGIQLFHSLFDYSWGLREHFFYCIFITKNKSIFVTVLDSTGSKVIVKDSLGVYARQRSRKKKKLKTKINSFNMGFRLCKILYLRAKCSFLNIVFIFKNGVLSTLIKSAAKGFLSYLHTGYPFLKKKKFIFLKNNLKKKIKKKIKNKKFLTTNAALKLRKKKTLIKSLLYQVRLSTPLRGQSKQKGRLVSMLNLHSLPHSFFVRGEKRPRK